MELLALQFHERRKIDLVRRGVEDFDPVVSVRDRLIEKDVLTRTTRDEVATETALDDVQGTGLSI
ncbi:hypothetical protein ASG63_04850 [Methylobacterium sp. Leaf94]|nr:hypothetical protein ASG63_04850 [Methylobacterium sp. Leaf94]